MSDKQTIYGIQAIEKKLWYVLDTGEVFHTPHRAVAMAQLQHVKYHCIPEYTYAVREFTPSNECSGGDLCHTIN